MAKRRIKRSRRLYKVIADGHVMSKLGHSSFPRTIALDMADDLRHRGYKARAVPTKWRG
jgi:hypothetical protein